MSWSRVIPLGVALIATEAFTSEHHEEVTLEQALPRSTLVFIAAPASPASRTVSISIAPPGKSEEQFPPYRQVLQRYTVREVLWSQSEAPEKGTVLELAPADSGTRLSVHKKYYLEELRKIPIYTYYAATVPPAEGAKEVIVLATSSSDGYEFAAAGSIEGLGARAKVQALLAKGAAGPVLRPITPPPTK
jgi:hypothetical protein